jgi:hypothetical protein
MTIGRIGLFLGIGIILGMRPLPAAANCSLPSDFSEVLASTDPSYRLLRLSDLNQDDQHLWVQTYLDACPGVVHGHFTGHGTEYAALLVPINTKEHTTKLVLFTHTAAGRLEVREILSEPTEVPQPVVRRGPPDEYKDIENDTVMKTNNDVVLLEHLESGLLAIIFVHDKPITLILSD